MEDKIFKYDIPSLNSEGWGKFIITSNKNTCDLFSITDYGNYAYSWYSTGCDDARKFLLKTDTSYLIDKLTYDNKNEAEKLYIDETIKNIKEGIKEYFDYGNYRDEERMQEDLDLANDIENEYTLNKFYEECHIEEPWCFEVRGYSPQARAMRDVLLPRLQDAIREDKSL